MKSTGMVRRIDDLGRVVIPKEIRKTKDIAAQDDIEIFVEGENIVLRKYNPCCTFCDSNKDIFEYKGKKICKACASDIYG